MQLTCEDLCVANAECELKPFSQASQKNAVHASSSGSASAEARTAPKIPALTREQSRLFDETAYDEEAFDSARADEVAANSCDTVVGMKMLLVFERQCRSCIADALPGGGAKDVV